MKTVSLIAKMKLQQMGRGGVKGTEHLMQHLICKDGEMFPVEITPNPKGNFSVVLAEQHIYSFEDEGYEGRNPSRGSLNPESS